MKCLNTNKQRMVIWYSQTEPLNVYDLWLHDTGYHDYVLSVYDSGLWYDILSGGSGSCGCPNWVKVLPDPSSWWYKAAAFNWDTLDLSNYVTNQELANTLSSYVQTSDLKQVQLKQGNTTVNVYGPSLASITIPTSINPGDLNNQLQWTSGGSLTIGTLKSIVNGQEATAVIKYSPDIELKDPEDHTTLPTSKAVKDYVDLVEGILNTNINGKQLKLTGGTNGQILSRLGTDSFRWIDDKWFVYQSVQSTNPTFKRNSLSKDNNSIDIQDAYMYECGTISSITINNINNPSSHFKAGSVIKFTADSVATLTIGLNYNVINPYNLTENSNIYTLTQGKIYYVYIKMDNVIIYEVGTAANPVEPEDPSNYIDFDFIYWYGLPEYTWDIIKLSIDDKLENNPSINDSDFPVFSKYIANNISITDLNIDSYKLDYDGTDGTFFFILLKSGSNVKVLIKDSLGINDYMNAMTSRPESYTYINDGVSTQYNLYLINLFSNTKIVIQNS